jgi:hypothetical protein
MAIVSLGRYRAHDANRSTYGSEFEIGLLLMFANTEHDATRQVDTGHYLDRAASLEA